MKECNWPIRQRMLLNINVIAEKSQQDVAISNNQYLEHKRND